MNQRGFTVIELLVSLTVIGVIMSLLIGSMVSTRKVTRESELRADAFTSVTRSMDLLRNSVQTMVPDQSARFDSSSLKFSYRKAGETHNVQVEQQGDGFKLNDSAQSGFLFPGSLSFRYLVGQEWLEQLTGNQQPLAVAISAQYPESTVDYELVINVLFASNTPTENTSVENASAENTLIEDPVAEVAVVEDAVVENTVNGLAEAQETEVRTTDLQEVQDVE